MSDYVFTIIGAAQASEMIAKAADEIAQALILIGARAGKPDWLAEGLVCDIPFDDAPPDQAEAAGRAAIRRALGAAPIDVVAQPVAGRKKALLVADMEGTVIANEMLDELAELRGLRAQISEITARAMNGEVDFVQALKERVALLKGLPEGALADAGKRIRFDPGARALVATMRAHGAATALVSGGFHIYADRVRDEIGFDTAFANDLDISGGRLSGTVREPILAREAKLATLTQMALHRGLSLQTTIAIGDGANDLPMIAAAGLGVAYHAKPAVGAQAPHRIDHADLTALLYAQGYRPNEILAG